MIGPAPAGAAQAWRERSGGVGAAMEQLPGLLSLGWAAMDGGSVADDQGGDGVGTGCCFISLMLLKHHQ